MKASELRDMSVEELQTKLTELKEELFNQHGRVQDKEDCCNAQRNRS